MTKISNQYSLTNILTTDLANSRLGINNVSPAYSLDITGTTKVSGILTLGSTISNGTYAYTLPSATGTLATTSDVTTAVANLVDTAPSTLDTLNELAAALGDDPNFATTVTNSIATKLPLAGGTLTGTLNGTSASFAGDVTITGANALRGSYGAGGGTTNFAAGDGALASNTTGPSNTAVGYHALTSNTTGGSNTVSGMNALKDNTTGSTNTAIGSDALEVNTTGSYNTATGDNALGSNTTASYNTATGRSALISNTVGMQNTAIGMQALQNNTTGSNNTANGYQSGLGIKTGSGNTVLGANVSGLAGGLTNNIILANGTGAIKAQHDGSDWALTGGATFSGALSGTSFSNAGLVASEVFNATKSNAGYYVGYFKNTSATGFGLYIRNGLDTHSSIEISNAAGTNNTIQLYGSGAATFSSSVTASAFIPSGATIPTNGMYLSAANTLNFATNTTNRLTIGSTGNVGIGNISAAGTLHGVSYGTTKLHIDGGTDRGQIIVEGDSVASIVMSDNGATADSRVFITQVNDGLMTFKSTYDSGTSKATIMTMTSGGGVGINGATSTNGVLEVLKASSSIAQFSLGWNTSNHTDMYVDATGNFYIQPQGTTQLTITSTGAATFNGNVGIGVTPSAWYTYSKVLQLGGGASIEGRSNIYDYSSINTNSYADVSGTSLYMNNGYASRYYQYLGSHNWLTAPSGTAGNAISFTQAMTLNASGNLSVGNTNDSYKLDVSGTAAVSSLIVGGTSTLTGRVQGTEIGVTRDGADTIGDGPWFRCTNAATTRQMLTQLNASNGLTTWAYNGSTWSSIYTITQAGAATFSSSVTNKVTNILADGAGVVLQGYVDNTLRIAFRGSGYNDGARGGLLASTGDFSSTLSVTGDVGIGTALPSAKLDIVSPSAASSPYVSKAIQFAPSNHPTRTWSLNYDDGGSVGNGFNISAGSTRILYLNANGNVGIGTASPQSALSFASTSHIGVATIDGSDNGYLSIGGGGGGGDTRGAGVYMSGNERTTYGGQLAIFAGDVVGSGFISFNTGGSERMRILANGTVQMNVEVFNTNTTGTTRTLFIGNGTYSIGGVSSIRASKKNIENVLNVDWLYQLNPVNFNYRKKDEDGSYTEEIYEELNYGLIAEDTAPIADFLINYNDKEDNTKEMIGIEYFRLITPMLKAIQELKAEIDLLKGIAPIEPTPSDDDLE
jgi:hypothetical protein